MSHSHEHNDGKKSDDTEPEHKPYTFHVTGRDAYLRFLKDLADDKDGLYQRLKKDGCYDCELDKYGIFMNPSMAEEIEKWGQRPHLPTPDAIREFLEGIRPPPSGEGHFFLLWNVTASGGRVDPH